MDAYQHLIQLLDRHGAHYRVIEHAPVGTTEVVSALRGHAPSQAAKCIVLLVKIGKKVTRHVLAVVPGDMRVNLAAVKSLYDGTFIKFADPEQAERLAGSVSGTILPFAFDPALELIVDPAVLQIPEIYFNAARLDRSLCLRTSDYIEVAQPRVERIAVP